MFEFRHYPDSGLWQQRIGYLIVPEILYSIFLFGGMIVILLSIGVSIYGFIKKKKKNFLISRIIVFFVSLMMVLLTLNGFIVADSMFGG